MFRELDKSAGGQRYHHRFHTELPTVMQLKAFANIMVEVRLVPCHYTVKRRFWISDSFVFRSSHNHAQELRSTRGDLGLLLAVSRGINAAVHQLVSFSEQLQVRGVKLATFGYANSAFVTFSAYASAGNRAGRHRAAAESRSS